MLIWETGVHTSRLRKSCPLSAVVRKIQARDCLYPLLCESEFEPSTPSQKRQNTAQPPPPACMGTIRLATVATVVVIVPKDTMSEPRRTKITRHSKSGADHDV